MSYTYFLNQLKGLGANLYPKDDNLNVLCLKDSSLDSCEQIAFILSQHIPPDLSLTVILPKRMLSHFAIEAFIAIRNDPVKQKRITIKTSIPGQLIKTFPTAPTARYQHNYDFLAMTNRYFNQTNKDFYDFLNNKHALFNFLNGLKVILQNPEKKLHRLVYELFIVHHLIPLPAGLKTIFDLNQAIKINGARLQTLKDTIFSFLGSDEETITPFLDRTISTDTSGINSKAQKRALLRAQALWGKTAFYESNKNAGIGLYWYGRCIAELPSFDGEEIVSLTNQALFDSEQNGLYWIRMAATRYNCPLAVNYLKRLQQTHQSFGPSDYYQFIMATEELHLSTGPCSSTPEHQFITLFPEQDLTSHLSDMLSEIRTNPDFSGFKQVFPRLCIGTFDDSVPSWFGEQIDRVIRKRLHPDPRFQSHVYRLQEFYLNSMLRDPLIEDHQKIELYKLIRTARANNLCWIGNSAVTDWQACLDRLMLYSEIPLGVKIVTQILPVLNRYLPKDNTPLKLDNNQPIKNHSVALRRSVISQFFYDTLNRYLKTSTLLNLKVDPKENPDHVVVLIRNFFAYSIEHFHLGKTKIDTELALVMEKLTDEFSSQRGPDSFGFKSAMTRYLDSFITTAKVANTSRLKPRDGFGIDTPSKPKETSLLHTAAAGIEIVHITLPLLLGITGIGIPAALTTFAFFEYLQITLSMIHQFFEKVEHVMHDTDLLTSTITKSAHLQHFIHESGLVPHEHENNHNWINYNTLSYLESLFSRVADINLNVLQLVVDHWVTIYQPVTDRLTEKSNTQLGALLIEIFLRSLTHRLAKEENNRGASEHPLPATLAELFTYIDETMWAHYSPGLNDSQLLLSKDKTLIPALSIIYPQRLKAQIAGQIIDIDIQPSHRVTPSILANNMEASRYASRYEVVQLNRLREAEPLIDFNLSGSGHPMLALNEDKPLVCAWKESKIVQNILNKQSQKLKLVTAQGALQGCMSRQQNLKEIISSLKSSQIPGILKQMQVFHGQLLTLDAMLDNTIQKTSVDLEKQLATLPFIDRSLLPIQAIQNRVKTINIFLILVCKKYQLQAPGIVELALASKSEKELTGMLKGMPELQILYPATTSSSGLFSKRASTAPRTGACTSRAPHH